MNEPKAIRSQKHIDLSDAINDVSTIIGDINDLIARIKDGDRNLEVTPEGDALTPIPSLLEVLDSGASRLRSHVDTVHQRLAELRELLF
ncbi:MAG: hypothetical protein AB2766_11430 [Candidatus Thiodiazotropha endolucinida]